MYILAYLAYGLAILIFLVFSGFAVHRAFQSSLISPRIKMVTWIFIVVAVVLLALSLYFFIVLIS